ncbi:MAG: peptide/nickel transport system permease protein [Gaiellaceae bacterium]|nr:peptide/nickel transport system permease protein [Gaiellaceae bacterium]
MLTYLVRRVAWAGVLFLAITMVTFIMFFVLPVSNARFVRRTEYSSNEFRRALVIDGPIYRQYGEFVGRILRHGSLGSSFDSRADVNAIVGQAAPVTLSLVVGGAIVWMLIAIPVGIMSATRPRSLRDRISMTAVLIGISAHPIWIGLMLSYFVGYRWHLAPINGYCDLVSPATSCGGPIQWGFHLMLPWITFAILFAALYARMIRANVMDVLDEDYVRTARAKGMSEWKVLRLHVLRNAFLPVVTMLGMDIAVSLNAAVFVETVYGLPGLGRTAVRALQRQDLPVILGIVVWTTLTILILNLVVDVLYTWLDPRVRVVMPGHARPEAPVQGTVVSSGARDASSAPV